MAFNNFQVKFSIYIYSLLLEANLDTAAPDRMRTYLLEDIVGDTPRFREHLSSMEKEMSVLEKQIDEVQCQLKKKEKTKQMESPVLRDSSGMELLSETGNLLRCVFDV
ncbi:MAG: uncharacterized protein A8A55_2860, partial [Amphiamblys sp. WSBS2006]